MKNYLTAALLALLINTIPEALAYQNQCEALFKNGLETHKPGDISFGWEAVLVGGFTGLDAKHVFHSPWNSPCNGESCQATGNASQSFPLLLQQSVFPGDRKKSECRNGRCDNNDHYDAYPDAYPGGHKSEGRDDNKRNNHGDNRRNDRDKPGQHQGSGPELPKPSHYVSTWGMLEIPGTGSAVEFSSITVGAFAELIFAPGDYWVDSLDLGYDSRVTQSGRGQLRLFVKNLTIGTSSEIGSADNYPLIKTEQLSVASFGSANAFIYADKQAEIGNFAVINGALSASDINLQAFARVEFAEAERNRINYGWICDYDDDGIYDGFDDDADNDGFLNDVEAIAGTDPYNADDVPSDLDGDGIADAVDDDIDNDGYTNAEEEAEGTDPYNPDSFPLPDPPQLKLTTDNNQTVYSDAITVTGLVVVGDLPVSRVAVTGDSGVRLIAINSGGYFNIELALTEGDNSFVFDVVDDEGYSDSIAFSVTYIVPFSINSVEPANGFVTESEFLNVTISVTAADASPVVRVGDTPLLLLSQNDGEFIFSGDIELSPGDNGLTIRAVAKQRSIQQLIHYRFEPDEADYPAPVIVIKSPNAEARTRQETTAFYAAISSRTGRLKALLNDEVVSVTSLGDEQYSVSSSVTLEPGENHILLVVTDALDKQSSDSLSITQDVDAPKVELDNNWQPAPDINQLAQSTVQIAGTAYGNDVNSVAVNGEELALTLTADGYAFSHSLRIPPQQEVLLSITASDDLGNKETTDYYLYSESNLTMSWISPQFPVTWFSEKGTGYPFAVRLNDESGTESYSAYLDPGMTEVTFQKAGSILTGTLPSQLENGNYKLIVEAVYGTQSQTLSGEIEVLNQEDLPLEVISVLPENQSEGIEPDSPVQVTFNRPVTPEKAGLEVYKTLHGKTYVNADSSGEDFLHSKGYQIQDVHYSRAVVSGGYSLVNNDQTLLFYPDSDLGYNAEVSWNVVYDNEVISRQIFNTRSLPTLIEGGVIDSLGQGRADLLVEIEELHVKTKTNNDGGFTFGYKSKDSENFPEGEYHLVVNSERGDVSLGSIRTPVSITGGVLNKIPLIRVPNISNDILPVSVAQQPDSLRLVSGKLNIDLNSADLDFPSSERSIHAQFVPASALVRDIMDGLAPLWFYQLQPFEIRPSENINVTMELPTFMGGYEYLPGGADGESYVLMLGYNTNKNIIEAVGVAKITGTTLTTVNAVAYDTLDYIGYSPILPDTQDVAEQYINNEISFIELVSKAMLDRP